MVNIVIPEKFTPLYDKKETRRRFISNTGRISGKTVGYTYKALDTVMSGKDVWILRAVNAKIKTSIFRTIQNTIGEWGLKNEFKFIESSPFRIIHRSGGCIDFSGLDMDPLSLKGYENRNGKGMLGMVWFEEFTELSDPDNMHIAIKTATRYMANDGIICWSGNPSKFNSHWSWDWTENCRNMPDEYCMIDINFRDIWDLINEASKDEILLDYKSDKRLFDFTYDGKRLTLEGLVYYMVNKEMWIEDLEEYDFYKEYPVELGIGVDVATENDKTAAVPVLMTSKGRAIVLDSYVYNPKKVGHKSIDHQIMEISSWYQGLYKNYNFIKGIPVKWAFDPSNMGMRNEIERYLGAVSVQVNKDVLKDIMKVQSLANTNRLYFLETESNLYLKDELEKLTWKTKKSNRELALEEHGLSPQKYVLGEDDCENALRYILQTLFKNHTSLYVIDKLKKKNNNGIGF